MGATDSPEVLELLDKVRRWPPDVRRSVAREILESLTTPDEGGGGSLTNGGRGRPVEELIGLGAGPGAPPTDAEVRQWVAEWREAKHG